MQTCMSARSFVELRETIESAGRGRFPHHPESLFSRMPASGRLLAAGSEALAQRWAAQPDEDWDSMEQDFAAIPDDVLTHSLNALNSWLEEARSDVVLTRDDLRAAAYLWALHCHTVSRWPELLVEGGTDIVAALYAADWALHATAGQAAALYDIYDLQAVAVRDDDGQWFPVEPAIEPWLARLHAHHRPELTLVALALHGLLRARVAGQSMPPDASTMPAAAFYEQALRAGLPVDVLQRAAVVWQSTAGPALAATRYADRWREHGGWAWFMGEAEDWARICLLPGSQRYLELVPAMVRGQPVAWMN